MSNPEDYQLRPIEESDLEQILEWRNSEKIRSNMYTDHIISLYEHRAWFLSTRDNQSVSHHICEYNQQPIGVINFTNIDQRNKKCYWGFYLGVPDVMIGRGSIMGVLSLGHAFEVLNVRKLCSEVFKFNEKSIRFHEKLGFHQEGYFIKHILKDEKYEDLVILALFKDQWSTVKDDLQKSAFKLR